jgi:hypothetical protein
MKRSRRQPQLLTESGNTFTSIAMFIMHLFTFVRVRKAFYAPIANREKCHRVAASPSGEVIWQRISQRGILFLLF